MIERYGVGPLKINNVSGNASINFGDASFSSNSITVKNQGKAFAIGDGTLVCSQMNNGWLDPDVTDQDQSASPEFSSSIQP